MKRNDLTLCAFLAMAALPAWASDMDVPDSINQRVPLEGTAGTHANLGPLSAPANAVATIMAAQLPATAVPVNYGLQASGAPQLAAVPPTYGLHVARVPHVPHQFLLTDTSNDLQSFTADLQANHAAAIALILQILRTSPTTGLPNRARFLERIGEIERTPEAALGMLDMNNFGAINYALAELYGVTEGRRRADKILALAGATLAALGSQHDVTVSHLSGEEFIVDGEARNVLTFAAAGRATLPTGRLLEAVGMGPGTKEWEAIQNAMKRIGREGQPVGDFTYGVAPVQRNKRGVVATIKAADGALNHGKENGRRGAIELERPDGYYRWDPPHSVRALVSILHTLPENTLPNLVDLYHQIALHLQDAEALFRAFQGMAFVDPLTLVRNYDYVGLQAPEWDALYANGPLAYVVMLSGRNLREINRVLGHPTGDEYLRQFAAIAREVVADARAGGLDVQEVVRVGTKELLLVGRNARAVGRKVAREVSWHFRHGEMLSPGDVQRVRDESVANGSVPRKRKRRIGTVRMVSAPIRREVPAEREDRSPVMAALDNGFDKLEHAKNAEAPQAVTP